jgi:two-component system, cell cycle response regulator DivK
MTRSFTRMSPCRRHIPCRKAGEREPPFKQELTFQLKFPARIFAGVMSMCEYPDEAEGAKTPEREERARDKQILIVEDDRLSMTLLSDSLNAHGYRVLKTSEGSEAINLARDEQPDLILMDIRLPGISGFDVTRLLKQDNQTKAIPSSTAVSSKSPQNANRIRLSGRRLANATPAEIAAIPPSARGNPTSQST